ncbi:hypothetical protein [Plantactinospora sp. CA-290183]|uniref:hypothetical protein n=1 Tax=Plantactinospora sp. CA-290183 TaxID=3240006 RepID=UPI003D8C93F8
MARRRAQPVQRGELVMPAELRARPSRLADADAWCDNSTPPPGWGLGTRMWRQVRAHSEWSRARHAWRVEHDRSYWWWWRSRDLTPPPRAVRNEYAREVTGHGPAS